MKHLVLFSILLFFLNSCQNKISTGTGVKSGNEKLDSTADLHKPSDSPVQNAKKKPKVSEYNLIINNGNNFSVHKDAIESILAKIKIDHSNGVIKLEINTPEVIKEINEDFARTENLAALCNNSSDEHYMVSDNSMYSPPYFRETYKQNKNRFVIIENHRLSFLHGCNGFDLFIWKTNADSLILKRVIPDFIAYPDMNIYWTDIDIADVVTNDSVNFFISLRKLVNWSDPVEAEHTNCDVENEIIVFYYNSSNFSTDKIYNTQIEGIHTLDRMSLKGSFLVINHSQHSQTILFKDREGNITEPSPDEYPYENPELTEFKQLDEVVNISDTLNVENYLK